MNSDATFIDVVNSFDEDLIHMSKGPSSGFGTGGMQTKLSAAHIANEAGADMVIANGEDIMIINDIMTGASVGTLFTAHKKKHFNIMDYIENGE